MGVIEILFISIGLAMDAFALSLCLGLTMYQMNWFNAFKTGVYFGVFQGLMPLIGYYLGRSFAADMVFIDHWVASALLLYTGCNMIKNAENDESIIPSFSMKSMLPLSIACSIDAFAIGISFSFFEMNIFMTVLLIALITCIISIFGVKAGQAFGNHLKAKANYAGGGLLILMAVKLIIEHLFMKIS